MSILNPFYNIGKPIVALDQSIAALDQPLDQSIAALDQSIDQHLDQSIDQHLDQSIDQPLDQSIDQPLDQSIDQHLDQPLDQHVVAFDQSIAALDQQNARGRYDPYIYILCLKNAVDEIENIFHLEYIPEDSINNFVLIKCGRKLLHNKHHIHRAAHVDKNFLERYNKYEYKLNDINTVICIPNISEKDIVDYCHLYENNDSLEKYIRLRILIDYFKCFDRHYTMNQSLKSLLCNMKETKYWTNPYNCKLNITRQFIDRKFKMGALNKLDPTYKAIFDKMYDPNNKNHDYLAFINKKNVYIDAASGYKKYKLPKQYPNAISKMEINELFDNTINKKDRFYLFNMLLVSKVYCHLVINNKYLLNKLAPMFRKYMPLYKYLFGYAWIVFYTEECVRKSHTTIEDRYVFDLDTANKLPFFPFNSDDAHMNPYLPLLISKKTLDFANNFRGVGMISGFDGYGLCTHDEFIARMNIFTSGIDGFGGNHIFKDINWDGIAITGSVMPACLQKQNPLLDLFKHIPDIDQRYERYFQEYYPTSDIDIMCNYLSKTDFVDKAYEIYECIKNNIGNKEIKLVPHKNVAIFVSTEYVRKYMVDNAQLDLHFAPTFENIIANHDSIDVKDIFYKIYAERKEEKAPEQKYYDIYDIVPIERIKIYFTEHENKEGDDLIAIRENLKYKIESPYLVRSIEFFQIKYKDFFSTVSKFHLPCVRTFYDGHKVYLLPSAISAFMTMVNLDYKYFSSSTAPYEINFKYNMRGYTIISNKREISELIDYCSKAPNWKNLAKLKYINEKNIKLVLNVKDINQDYFKPRMINAHLYELHRPVDYNYSIVNNVLVHTNKELIAEYEKRYGNNKSNINILKYKTINEKGYIIPLKLWLIDAAYDEL